MNSHADQPALNDGAVSAVKRDLSGSFAWDKAPGVTYLIAASLAAWSLLSVTTPKPKHTPDPLMDRGGGGGNGPVELDFFRTPF